jgi:branched-chain amino acid transport system substrate-binding protein
MAIPRRRWLAACAAGVFGLWFQGCSQRPVRLGFLGGLTGPSADLGVAGRDGALLAVESHNKTGQGPVVELLVFDNGQHPGAFNEVLQDMRAAGVSAVIGPMTSSMAAHWIPLANAEKLLTVSPTVTSSDFSGHDDWFFRVCSSTREYASHSADHHVQTMGWKRFAIIRDDGNAAYTRTWATHFVARLQSLGGDLVHQTVYRLASPGASFSSHVAEVLATKPEVVVLVANAVDTANLAQLLRKANPNLPLVTAEWAATEQLIELGGRAVHGVLVAQYFDRSSNAAPFVAFKSAFQQRYRREPGFAEVAAFDATGVLLQAIRQQHRRESLRETLLRLRRFDGLQQPVLFDGHGDASRQLYITRIVDGRYRVES